MTYRSPPCHIPVVTTRFGPTYWCCYHKIERKGWNVCKNDWKMGLCWSDIERSKCKEIIHNKYRKLLNRGMTFQTSASQGYCTAFSATTDTSSMDKDSLTSIADTIMCFIKMPYLPCHSRLPCRPHGFNPFSYNCNNKFSLPSMHDKHLSPHQSLMYSPTNPP